MSFWRRRPGFAGRRRLLRGAGLADPMAAPVPFTPTEVDAERFLAQLDKLADSLRLSVDEATGHALDKLVNCWSAQWVARASAEYHHHLSRAEDAKGQAAARTALTRDLWLRDLSRLVEVGMAVEATLTRLVDEAAPDRNGEM